MLALLALVTIVTFLMGGFMPLFGIASGLLFVYYLAVYFGAKFVGDTPKKLLFYGLLLLFFIPIVLLAIDPDKFFDFLLHSADVHLDMR